MSTFGEIVEPSSRANWEDWDEVQNNHHLPELRWQYQLQVPDVIEKFFLFEGKFLWNSMKAKENTHEINSIKEANLHLYKTPETTNYVCVIKDCDMLHANDIVKLLQFIIIRSQMVVTIQEKPLSEYQTNRPPTISHVVRKITTTNRFNLMNVDYLPKLEQPNLITGVSAGVFCLREHLHLSAASLVIYMDHSQDHQMQLIDNLLQKLNISEVPQMKPNEVFTSNLYI